MNQHLVHEIEEEYYGNLSTLNRMEDELSDYYQEFQQRTNYLLDIVHKSFRGIEEIDELNHFIHELEESQHQYYRQYCQDRDAIDEERHRQKHLFDQRLDEVLTSSNEEMK